MVTGGSRGVGAAVAEHLARAGAVVAVTYHRNASAADDVLSAIRSFGGTGMAVQASAADAASWADAAEAVTASLGDVDLLVSNAGTASRGRTISGTEGAEFLSLMNIHAFGPLSLVQRLLPGMRAKGRADIVMVSSAIVETTPANSAPYAMAKAAMETACKTLAREERDHGVRVNIIAPGLVDTDMGAKLVAATTDSTMSETEATAACGRVCKPADVARLVTFLAGPGGEYITGQRIVIDGGGAAPAIY
jgi:NAD(P)-dependent dehydrogenase (short-subunit alcohol dehydrogenase family)